MLCPLHVLFHYVFFTAALNGQHSPYNVRKVSELKIQSSNCCLQFLVYFLGSFEIHYLHGVLVMEHSYGHYIFHWEKQRSFEIQHVQNLNFQVLKKITFL